MALEDNGLARPVIRTMTEQTKNRRRTGQASSGEYDRSPPLTGRAVKDAAARWRFFGGNEVVLAAPTMEERADSWASFLPFQQTVRIQVIRKNLFDGILVRQQIIAFGELLENHL